MTAKRLFAIGFIFCCATVAWLILGTSVYQRTGETDGVLREEVSQLWGGRHVQVQPNAWYEEPRQVAREVPWTDADGVVKTRTVTETVMDRIPVPIASSRITADLDLDQRRKGLLWYDTYAVKFRGAYAVRNTTPAAQHIFVHFAFPSREGIYDGFHFRVDGNDAPVSDLSAGATTSVEVAPGGGVPVLVEYRSRGLDSWSYSFGEGVAQVTDFALNVTTDFTDVDFPAGTMSPTRRKVDGPGLGLNWTFQSLVTGQKVGVDLPSRLEPGPLAARISFFAPVSLLFFVTVLVILGVLRGQSLHPMNYFFLAGAFFAFHLLLAYLVDHLDIHASFAIASVTSVFLVVTYLASVGGLGRTALEAGLAQLLFLVLFSYAFFYEGYTGLTVTVGAILTLFVLMQATGRVDWNRAFAGASAPARVGPTEGAG